MKAKVSENTVIKYPYTLDDLRRDNPNTMFPADFDDWADYGVVDVAATEPPAADVVTEIEPALVDGVWTQQWSGRSYTPEERKALVPESVTMRQARLALLGIGKLGDVETAINGLPSPQKEAAMIEWEYSQTVERNRPFVQLLAPELGLTEQDLDDLFMLAQTL